MDEYLLGPIGSTGGGGTSDIAGELFEIMIRRHGDSAVLGRGSAGDRLVQMVLLLLLLLLNRLHWVDMRDAWVHVHAGVGVLYELLRGLGLVMVGWKIHLQVFCFARG